MAGLQLLSVLGVILGFNVKKGKKQGIALLEQAKNEQK
jgi:hypothetical protein